jgi:uncharacterized protein (DUF488 family)
VTRLVDVRTVPRSRHNPQFNRDTLPAELARAGVAYTHCPALGGLRMPRKDSINTAWRNASFRGFADYMQTREFINAVEDLLRMAEEETLAVMCAEVLPWRCHRSLIADALAARGTRVEHILSPGRREDHRLTAWARLDGRRVTYPGLPLSREGEARGPGRGEDDSP